MFRSNFLKTEGDKVYASCQAQVLKAACDVEYKLAAAVKATKSSLPRLVEQFQMEFNREALSEYQEKLCGFLDKEIAVSLQHVTTTSILELHRQTKHNMTGECGGKSVVRAA